MKRALAERAKQSGHPNGLAPPPQPPAFSTPVVDQSPPHKTPRVDSHTGVVTNDEKSIDTTIRVNTTGHYEVQPIVVAPAVAATTTTSTTVPPGSPTRPRLKRQRTGTTSAGAEDSGDFGDNDGNDASAFYLKHQNRALASELKGLQYQLRLFEQERDFRRQQCLEAGQALHQLEATWTQMEVALQLGLVPSHSHQNSETPTEQHLHSLPHETTTTTCTSLTTPPRSTGTGENVELIGALLDALAALGKKEPFMSATAETTTTAADTTTTIWTVQQKQLHDMTRVATSIAERATALQQWIWKLLPGQHSHCNELLLFQQDNGNHDKNTDTSLRLLDIAALAGQVQSLTRKCQDYEARMAELARTKDDAVASDRRVRRGLYRLASGQMKLDQVLQSVEEDEKESMASMMIMTTATTTTLEATTSDGSVFQNGQESGLLVDGAQLAQLKKLLQDMEEIASSRDTQIQQLLQQREENLKRINTLALPSVKQEDDATGNNAITDEMVQRSSLYTETATRLITAERQLNELRQQLQATKEKYATAKGDAELATKTMEDHMNKFKKRWAELTADDGDDNNKNGEEASHAGGSDENAVDHNQRTDTPPWADTILQAKRIVDLEHKLTQALENVRQADSIRMSLAEAHKMNESLQMKLEEFKAKNASLMDRKISSRPSSESMPVKDKATTGTPSSTSTPTSVEKTEKLQRDHRRLRKELAAAIASKESARAKQERAEKERDTLFKTNSRLLKQSTEKDDMNAKSLSTILHLKHLTEQLTQEKEVLEQQVKSAGQVALSARLATNAKERVAEEALKEKKVLADKMDELEQQCETLKQATERAEIALMKTKAEMTRLENDIRQARDRCDELVMESTAQEAEKRKLSESLAVAQREVTEASKKFATLNKSRGGHSEFTAEQLTTQVSVLKSRLACPVCNHRDKTCILLRCRHMFCKHCVEENVKNRSRKCPACGQRFDNKEVADVWL